ncbi:MAG: NUDIX domain-containing protein [Chloroflexi bacterium]|jgi:ADP-ribose pyrophosphatase|nr:NUDIX domain-containing protein [Chloroflexota bacterium]
MQTWKTLSRHTVLDRGKFLRVEDHVVQLPSGQIIADWPWVITPDFVNVVAITQSGEYLIFRQTKYSLQGTSLATVGGYLEPGEDPLVAAKRELREETGYAAAQWIPIGKYAVDGNRGAGNAYFFLATSAHPVAAIDADDLEEQELLHLSRAEVEEALTAGEFKLLPWATIIALALRHEANLPTT